MLGAVESDEDVGRRRFVEGRDGRAGGDGDAASTGSGGGGRLATGIAGSGGAPHAARARAEIGLRGGPSPHLGPRGAPCAPRRRAGHVVPVAVPDNPELAAGCNPRFADRERRLPVPQPLAVPLVNVVPLADEPDVPRAVVACTRRAAKDAGTGSRTRPRPSGAAPAPPPTTEIARALAPGQAGGACSSSSARGSAWTRSTSRGRPGAPTSRRCSGAGRATPRRANRHPSVVEALASEPTERAAAALPRRERFVVRGQRDARAPHRGQRAVAW